MSWLAPQTSDYPSGAWDKSPSRSPSQNPSNTSESVALEQGQEDNDGGWGGPPEKVEQHWTPTGSSAGSVVGDAITNDKPTGGGWAQSQDSAAPVQPAPPSSVSDRSGVGSGDDGGWAAPVVVPTNFSTSPKKEVHTGWTAPSQKPHVPGSQASRNKMMATEQEKIDDAIGWGAEPEQPSARDNRSNERGQPRPAAINSASVSAQSDSSGWDAPSQPQQSSNNWGARHPASSGPPVHAHRVASVQSANPGGGGGSRNPSRPWEQQFAPPSQDKGWGGFRRKAGISAAGENAGRQSAGGYAGGQDAPRHGWSDRREPAPGPRAQDDGWGAPAAAPSGGGSGWGDESAASNSGSNDNDDGGWGSEPVKAPLQPPARAQQQSNGNGRGAKEPSAPANAGGWGDEPASTLAPPVADNNEDDAGGWGAPTPKAEARALPQDESNGWGAEPASTQQQSSGGWGDDSPSTSNNDGGWGAPEPQQSSGGGGGGRGASASSSQYGFGGSSGDGVQGVCFKCCGKGHFARECPNSGPGLGGDEICYQCGQPGHFSRECPEGNCYRCRQTGHMARDCPQAGANGRDSCFRCSQSGHIARDCPVSGSGGFGSGSAGVSSGFPSRGTFGAAPVTGTNSVGLTNNPNAVGWGARKAFLAANTDRSHDFANKDSWGGAPVKAQQAESSWGGSGSQPAASGADDDGGWGGGVVTPKKKSAKVQPAQEDDGGWGAPATVSSDNSGGWGDSAPASTDSDGGWGQARAQQPPRGGGPQQDSWANDAASQASVNSSHNRGSGGTGARVPWSERQPGRADAAGKWGHDAYERQERSGFGGGDGGGGCYKCGQPGHFARECPTAGGTGRGGFGGGGGDGCFKCGKPGHFARECPDSGGAGRGAFGGGFMPRDMPQGNGWGSRRSGNAPSTEVATTKDNDGGWSASASAPSVSASNNDDSGGWGEAPSAPAQSDDNDDGGWGGSPVKVSAPIPVPAPQQHNQQQQTQSQAGEDDGGWGGSPEKVDAPVQALAPAPAKAELVQPIQEAAPAVPAPSAPNAESRSEPVAAAPITVPIAPAQPEEDDGRWGGSPEKVEWTQATHADAVEESIEAGWGGEAERTVAAESDVDSQESATLDRSGPQSEVESVTCTLADFKISLAPSTQAASSLHQSMPIFIPKATQQPLLFNPPEDLPAVAPSPQPISMNTDSAYYSGYISPIAGPYPLPGTLAPVPLSPGLNMTALGSMSSATPSPVMGLANFQPARGGTTVTLKAPGAPDGSGRTIVSPPVAANIPLPISPPDVGGYSSPMASSPTYYQHQQQSQQYYAMNPQGTAMNSGTGYVQGPDGAYYPVRAPEEYGYQPFGYTM